SVIAGPGFMSGSVRLSSSARERIPCRQPLVPAAPVGGAVPSPRAGRSGNRNAFWKSRPGCPLGASRRRMPTQAKEGRAMAKKKAAPRDAEPREEPSVRPKDTLDVKRLLALTGKDKLGPRLVRERQELLGELVALLNTLAEWSRLDVKGDGITEGGETAPL